MMAYALFIINDKGRSKKQHGGFYSFCLLQSFKMIATKAPNITTPRPELFFVVLSGDCFRKNALHLLFSAWPHQD